MATGPYSRSALIDRRVAPVFLAAPRFTPTGARTFFAPVHSAATALWREIKMKDTQSNRVTHFCVALAVAFITGIILLTAATPAAAQAKSYSVLHSFTGGADGAYPVSNL